MNIYVDHDMTDSVSCGASTKDGLCRNGSSITRENCSRAIHNTTKELRVYMSAHSRMGNVIFEYASLYGIANRNGRNPIFHLPKNHVRQSTIHGYTHFLKLFPNISIPLRKAIPKHTKVIYESPSATYDPKFECLPETDVHIRRSFESCKYFMPEYTLDIKREFQISPTIQHNTSIILHDLTYKWMKQMKYKVKPPRVTYIGVHVRMSDKRRSKEWRVAGKSYYEKAADRVILMLYS